MPKQRKPQIGDKGLQKKRQDPLAPRRGSRGPRQTPSVVRQDEAAVSPARPYSSKDIAAIREAVNLSQPVFAAALNVSSETVKKWEQGTREPDGASLRLLELAETHPDWILDALQLTRPASLAKLTPVKAARKPVTESSDR